ncbi:MAG: hypothetical protein EHM35_03325, partial [Planctomycetaceae bacterium]
MGLLMERGRKRAQFKWRQQAFEVGDTVTLPAPFGGLNLRDDITALKKNEARVLINFFPGSGLLEVRPGKARHASGLGATDDVKTLAGFVGYTASALLAGAAGRIWDVTAETHYPGNDTLTKVLLPFFGADASTTITDVNGGGHTHAWTAAGNAQIDTAQSVFGGSSLLLDGTGDWVTTADHAEDFTLGSSDWTVEAWVRPAVDGTLLYIAGQGDTTPTAATSSFILSRSAGNKIVAEVSDGAAFTTLTGTTDILAGVFYHVVLERLGN